MSWEPPETDGGTPVIQYIVEKKDATRTTGMWVLAGTVEADVTQYKVGNAGRWGWIHKRKMNGVYCSPTFPNLSFEDQFNSAINSFITSIVSGTIFSNFS